MSTNIPTKLKPCRIRQDKKWRLNGYLVTKNNKQATIRIGNEEMKVNLQDVWMKKRVRSKRHSKASEVYIPRKLRYRKMVEVNPISFVGSNQPGDFLWMIESGKYPDAVMLFNDNHEQWEEANPASPYFHDPRTHMRGGGNAAVRPFQRHKHAIGMPTGPYKSLKELKTYEGKEMTVKDIIVIAFHRIIDLFMERLDKDILYFSADPVTGKLGLGIFQNLVGKDVIDFISDQLPHLGRMIQYTRRYGKYPEIPFEKVDKNENKICVPSACSS